jgi:hypothetical protein
MLTICVAVALTLLLSAMVRMIRYWPAFVYVWLTLTPVPVAPSPKFHSYLTMGPALTLESLALKVLG